MKNRALVFSLMYKPLIGGAEIAIQEVAEHSEMDFDIITLRVSKNHARYEVLGNVRIHRIGYSVAPLFVRKILYIFWAPLFARFFMPLKPNRRSQYVVWGMMASYAGYAGWIYAHFLGRKKAFIVTLQEGDSHAELKRKFFGLGWLLRLMLKNADAVTVISTYLKDFAVSCGVEEKNVHIVPNGVDIKKFNIYTDNHLNEVKKSSAYAAMIALAKKHGDTIVEHKIEAIKQCEASLITVWLVTTSRLVQKNGIRDVVQALTELPDTIGFLIVGDGEQRAELELMVKDNNLEKRVLFFGQLQYEYIPHIVNYGDIFIRPSLSEGFGNSFIEAMAARSIVVGTLRGGIVDFLKDEGNGFAVVPEKPDSIVGVINTIVSLDEHRRDAIRENGFSTAQKYDWKTIAHQYDALMWNAWKNNTHIVIATGIYPPAIGGPAQYAFALVEQYQRDGFNVHVLTYERVEYMLPWGMRHLYFFIRSFVIFLKSDCCIALDTMSVGLPATAAALVLHVPLVIRTGGDFLWESYVERTGHKVLFRNFYSDQHAQHMLSKKEHLIKMLTMWTLHHAKKVVFSTVWQREIFIHAYNMNVARTAIVENYYGGGAKNDQQNNKISFEFIASTRPLKWKNIDLLERVFTRVRAKFPQISLVTHNLPYRQFTERMKQARAIILVSLGDISPNMVLDALRLGVPCIVTEENGITDRVGKHVMLVSPLDEKSIEQAIERMCSDDIREEYALQAKSFNFTHSWEEISQELLEQLFN